MQQWGCWGVAKLLRSVDHAKRRVLSISNLLSLSIFSWWPGCETPLAAAEPGAVVRTATGVTGIMTSCPWVTDDGVREAQHLLHMMIAVCGIVAVRLGRHQI